MDDITLREKTSTSFFLGLPARLRAAHHPLHQKAVTHRLEFRRYRVPFGREVRTAHRPWVEREGLLVRLEDEAGRSGYGEVAPIPWFGTETLEEAEEVLAKLGGAAEAASLEGIGERYGCVRFALASALSQDWVTPAEARRLPVAALLPAGKAALAAADQALESGFVALKWKVGVLAVSDELVVLDDLLARLPAHAKLRLDANGAWTTRQAATVLERCAARPIEFVEQPCFAEASQGAAGQRRVADALLGERLSDADRIGRIGRRSGQPAGLAGARLAGRAGGKTGAGGRPRRRAGVAREPSGRSGFFLGVRDRGRTAGGTASGVPVQRPAAAGARFRRRPAV